MDIMRRRMLQLVGFGAVAIASPELSSALDAETGGAFKTAMGPTSAAQKPGGTGANSGAVTTGGPSESHRPKRRAYKRRR
jgi:hypothetical protein